MPQTAIDITGTDPTGYGDVVESSIWTEDKQTSSRTPGLAFGESHASTFANRSIMDCTDLATTDIDDVDDRHKSTTDTRHDNMTSHAAPGAGPAGATGATGAASMVAGPAGATGAIDPTTPMRRAS